MFQDAYCNGDTVLTLYNSTGQQIALNDDALDQVACNSTCSYFEYTTFTTDTLTVVQSCYPPTSCGGNVAYVIDSVPAPPPPPIVAWNNVGGNQTMSIALPFVTYLKELYRVNKAIATTVASSLNIQPYQVSFYNKPTMASDGTTLVTYQLASPTAAGLVDVKNSYSLNSQFKTSFQSAMSQTGVSFVPV